MFDICEKLRENVIDFVYVSTNDQYADAKGSFNKSLEKDRKTNYFV